MSELEQPSGSSPQDPTDPVQKIQAMDEIEGSSSAAEPNLPDTKTSESALTAQASINPDNVENNCPGTSSLPQPELSGEPSAAAGSAGGIKVFAAPSGPSGSGSGSGTQTPAEIDEAFFTPTLSDVQAYHASVVARSKRLNEAPLLTSKYREEEKGEKERRKAEKWPQTTIRIKFSDGTQIQRTFPSTSPIQPVYAFVREALNPEAREKPFVLWQPPRSQYPEHPLPQPKKTPAQLAQLKNRTKIVPPANYGNPRGGLAPGLQGGTGGKETLSDLGLVPQSVLMIKFGEEEMNASGQPAPLLPELLESIAPLPQATPAIEESQADKPSTNVPKPPTGEKKMPKWLQKGLMKKK